MNLMRFDYKTTELTFICGLAASGLSLFLYCLYESFRNMGLPFSVSVSTFVVPFIPILSAACLALVVGEIKQFRFKGLMVLWLITISLAVASHISTTTIMMKIYLFDLLDQNIFYFRAVLAAIFTLIGAVFAFFIVLKSQLSHVVISLISIYITMLIALYQ